MTAPRVPWIGLVHARVVPGTDPFGGGAIGAYVNVVAFVRNAEEYLELVRADIANEDLDLTDVQDLDTVENYRAEDRISVEMDSIIQLLSEENRVEYDIFAPYLWDDA